MVPNDPPGPCQLQVCRQPFPYPITEGLPVARPSFSTGRALVSADKLNCNPNLVISGFAARAPRLICGTSCLFPVSSINQIDIKISVLKRIVRGHK